MVKIFLMYGSLPFLYARIYSLKTSDLMLLQLLISINTIVLHLLLLVFSKAY